MSRATKKKNKEISDVNPKVKEVQHFKIHPDSDMLAKMWRLLTHDLIFWANSYEHFQIGEQSL